MESLEADNKADESYQSNKKLMIEHELETLGIDENDLFDQFDAVETELLEKAEFGKTIVFHSYFLENSIKFYKNL